MSRTRGLAAILGFAVLMVVAAACSQPQSATPNPKVAPVDTPTAVDGGKLLETCPVTEMGPRENPVLVARGIDPIPSGFDAGNHAYCTFARPISSVMLELLRDGNSVVQQLIPMDEPTTDIKFPLSETPAQPIGADLDTGGYDHRITAATEDGEAVEVLFNADAIWVLDPASSPKDLARRAMIAAREAYAEAQALPYFGPALVAFEPVEWGDASLGCPKPDVMYAQIVTPGFRLVFEYQGQRHEYHTVQDGSTVVECEITSASTSPPEPPFFFPRQQPVAGIREVMMALLQGKLTAADGCLYVDDSNSDTSYLLVWPPDFTLSMEADAVLLFNGAGEVVARVGEEVRLSGGEVKSVRYLDELVRQSLPADCPGPYWIVGDVVGPA